ncbi:MAG: hypothetical protein ACR2PX_11655 [Endozoicomonas sp.]|uniref:hypothetical protein n=1 Tax=Endozoicomonas sp. TaxID=1892382 RepID=UPI003D9AD8F9
MNQATVLQDALFRSATIHQPHALKAFLAAWYLAKNYPDIEQEIWDQTHRLIEKTEIKINTVLSEHMEPQRFSSDRIHTRLNNAVFPAVYLVMKQWHSEKGIEDILSHYLVKAATADHYLSHHVTILLAFKVVHQQLSESQILPYLERLTEFVCTTYNKSKFSEPLISRDTPPAFENILEATLKQPGFFGHNLITIAWLHRTQNEIRLDLLHSMLSNLHEQATQPLEYPEDAMDQDTFQKTSPSENPEIFHERINHLIFHNTRNLHQVTLADALTYLREAFPHRTGKLSQIAEYYSN